MARNVANSGNDLTILVDKDTAIPISGGPLYPPIGFEVTVIDNLGTAGGSNITISGPINGTVTTATISANFGKAVFQWDGSTYIQLI